MAFVIDPSQENGGGSGGNKRPEVREGKKLVWAAGTTWGTSQSGNTKISTRFVVVDDPDNGSDIRGYVWETFTLTQNAAWKLRSMASAVGQKEPWDASVEAETDSVLTHSPVWVNIQLQEGTDGIKRPRIDGSFNKFGGEITPDMEKVLTEAEDHHKQSAQIARGGSSSAPPMSTAPPINDDEIPF